MTEEAPRFSPIEVYLTKPADIDGRGAGTAGARALSKSPNSSIGTSAHNPKFAKLIGFLKQVPAVACNTTPSLGFGSGDLDNGGWWVKFRVDIDHPLAWNVVHELGHILNYLSVDERLPTVFMRVSPPPYLNGGPRDYLSWVIECPANDMQPDTIADWLERRLPRPVGDEAAWPKDD